MQIFANPHDESDVRFKYESWLEDEALSQLDNGAFEASFDGTSLDNIVDTIEWIEVDPEEVIKHEC